MEGVRYYVSPGNLVDIYKDNQLLTSVLPKDIPKVIPEKSKSYIEDNLGLVAEHIIKDNPQIYWIRYRVMKEIK